MRTIVVTLLLTVAATAWADRREERRARALFKEATRLLKSGDAAAAVELYQEAYETLPNAKILLNMGAALQELGRQSEAAATFERYLTHAEADPARRDEIQAVLAEIDRRIGKLRVEVDVTDARVAVDGVPLGESSAPLSRRVEPGSHTVTAERAGGSRTTVTVVVSAGEERTVALQLQARETTPTSAQFVVGGAEVVRSEDAPVLSVAGQPEAVVRERLDHDGQVGLVVRGETETRTRSGGAAAGLSLGIGRLFEIAALALLHRTTGARATVSLFPWPDGRWKPFLRAGVPVFFAQRTMMGAHGATGLLVEWSRHVGFYADGGIEHFPQVDGSKTAVVFGLGAQARVF